MNEPPETNAPGVTRPIGRGVVDIVTVSAWFALLSGFAEVARLALGRFVLGQYIHRSLQTIWMAPLAHLLIFAVPALLCILVVLVRRRALSIATSVVVFGSIAILAVLLGAPKLSKWALVPLAIGVATQLARYCSRHELGFRALVRRTTPIVCGIFVVALIGGLGASWLGERRALAALPPVAGPAPNVLFIVMDTVRAQNLSLYGYGRQTSPELEKLAARGIVFDRTYSAAPWTLPSHAAMFTGRYLHETKAGWFHPLEAGVPTLAEALSERGFQTGGFVSNTLYCGEQSGLSRGFSHYSDYDLDSVGEIIFSTALGREIIALPWPMVVKNELYLAHRKRADEVDDDFLAWVDTVSDRPYFAFLNYMDAHEPYLPPDEFAFRFAPARPRNAFLDDYHKYTPQELESLMAAYDGGIAYIDHEIGRTLAELEKRGKLRNTIVIVTSDHGEEFGEHGYVSHSNSLHVQGIHIPLIVALPGGEGAGLRVAHPVTNRDLGKTILGLVGADGGGALPGSSLSVYWTGEGTSDSPILSEVDRAPNIAEWLPVAKGDLKSIVVGPHHLIRNADGQELLYDVVVDPDERSDLASVESFAGIRGEIRAALDSAAASTPIRAPSGTGGSPR